MELKQNELLPAERQIVTAEPELKTVGFGGPFLSVFLFLEILNKTKGCFGF
jgi:hypothetical protein